MENSQKAWERFYASGRVEDYLAFHKAVELEQPAVFASEEQHAPEYRRPDYQGTAHWGK